MTAAQNRGHSRPQILIVESDEAYRVVMAACAGLARCRAEPVTDLETAARKLQEHAYSLLIWGVSTGESQQAEAIADLRKSTDIPVLLLDEGAGAAQTSFEAGADHVLPKPFVPGALVGAIKASLRQSPSMLTHLVSRMEIRGMIFEERTLHYNGHELVFTRQEWELLALFLSHPNRFLNIREILRLGWRGGDYEAEQVRTYVSRLRQKLSPLQLPCQLISQQGRGYCLLID